MVRLREPPLQNIHVQPVRLCGAHGDVSGDRQCWKPHDMWLIYTWNIFQFLEVNSEQRFKLSMHLDNIVPPVSIVSHWHIVFSHCTTYISMHFHAFPEVSERWAARWAARAHRIFPPLSFLVARGGSNCDSPVDHLR